MSKIEYEIDLNESGRPCIKLNDDYIETAADKFCCFEITRYILQSMYSHRTDKLDQNTIDKLFDCINFLGQISDEMSELIWNNMKELGDLSLLTSNNYNIIVESIEDLHNIKYDNIIYNEKIYKRHIGFKVLVSNEMKIYILVDGIENENWR